MIALEQTIVLVRFYDIRVKVFQGNDEKPFCFPRRAFGNSKYVQNSKHVIKLHKQVTSTYLLDTRKTKTTLLINNTIFPNFF